MIPLAEIEAAARNVYAAMPPTPQYRVAAARAPGGTGSLGQAREPHADRRVQGARRHQPARALAAAGALPAASSARRAATTARASPSPPPRRRRCVIVVPHGNSADKNRAMRAFGAELIEFGRDFDEAREHAGGLARDRGCTSSGRSSATSSRGVATYALELFRAAPPLATVYVPIGCGSGICGLSARATPWASPRRSSASCRSARTPTRCRSPRARRSTTASADTMADGMAVRVPVPAALDVICAARRDRRGHRRRDRGRDARVLQRHAPASPKAPARRRSPRCCATATAAGERAAVILCGGNVDREPYLRVLGAGWT